jgi:hypothetical protein
LEDIKEEEIKETEEEIKIEEQKEEILKPQKLVL